MSEYRSEMRPYAGHQWFVNNDMKARRAMAKARVCYDWGAMKAARAKCRSLQPRFKLMERRRSFIAFHPERHRAVLARRLDASTALPDMVLAGMSFDRLARAVTRASGLSMADLTGRCRDIPHCAARSLLMWLIHKRTKASLTWIGKRFDRDHTTALNNIRRIETIHRGGHSMRPRLDRRVKYLLRAVKA